jgi:DNA-binding IclR family transcriptional regulator
MQSLQRAVAILRCFTEQEPELGVLEISRRLDLHKSTVSRMLTTLQAEDLVSKKLDTGKYRLGLGLVSLAGVALGGLNIRAAAQPHMGELAEASQETVNVTIQDGPECVNIESIASPKPIRYVGWIGRRTPLYSTASGKVILAHEAEDQRGALLPDRLRKYTEFSVTNRKLLAQQLTRVCQDGYAIVHEEFEAGFSAAAAPVYDYEGILVGTIAVSGPTFRFGPGILEKFIPILLKTTQNISRDLGYMPLRAA